MKWKELSAQERYRIVEMALSGKTEIRQLCETFGVSRQTLYRAMEAVERAAVEALEPKRRGRKAKAPSDAKVEELEKERTCLEKELKKLQTRYDVTRTILELERKIDRGETLPGEKKPRRSKK